MNYLYEFYLFSLILHNNMVVKCVEDPFNMGLYFLLKGPSYRIQETS